MEHTAEAVDVCGQIYVYLKDKDAREVVIEGYRGERIDIDKETGTIVVSTKDTLIHIPSARISPRIEERGDEQRVYITNAIYIATLNPRSKNAPIGVVAHMEGADVMVTVEPPITFRVWHR